MTRRLVGMGIVLATVCVLAAGVRVTSLQERRALWDSVRSQLPSPRNTDGYVGAGACKPCHPHAFASWHHSYHRTMTQAARPAAVKANFDASLSDDVAVARRGDSYWVRMAAAGHLLGVDSSVESTSRWQQVVMATGSHHMQIFWVREPTTAKLVAFPWAYLLAEKRWVQNEWTLLRPDVGELAYTWNDVCVMCHAVAGQPGLESEPVSTRAVDLGIACEACHGPGREHIEQHQDPLTRHLARQVAPDGPRDQGARVMTNPDRLTPREGSEICGQCHSVWLPKDEADWRQRGLAYRPGDSLDHHANLVQHPTRADQPWIDEVLVDDADFLHSRFWSDGMIRVTGREYNGVLESPCAASPDFGCPTCHSMHDYVDRNDQLSSRGTNRQACIGCHPAIEADVPAHTHHAEGSTGSDCYNCHMPHTTYGLLTAVRSHQIDSPDAQVTDATGRPNACNQCHVDQTLTWTATWLSRWYGQPLKPTNIDAGREDIESPADTVDDPRHSTPDSFHDISATVRWLLAGDAGQRALAAWTLAWPPARAVSGSTWQAPLLHELRNDPYPAVRLVAERALRRLDEPVAPSLVCSACQADSAESPDTRQRRRLQTADGQLDTARLQQLVRTRDDRPVDLRE